ncbi:mRNA-degrading endonuclease RelE of RelBE toxin-antitoxin system [Runella defluvii]|uniref:mRNA-degrading endonuclease RelE of RelBE toxin-antitoxin system n=1 Tax=Runella defluvii TaxID=370973 RepID=A0A7W5ZJU4_9BACT|nr:type II toxin-antitoxin system RelE/ParE family toxin [Runella defluvii]MBB3838627.1 mRNA-degrading endonuclease RelE of RelBE toxin-antitoxin system [Runella defluvii]
MSYNVEVTHRFQKEAKRLSKKYPSIKTDLLKLIEDLEENPIQGSSLGKSSYKIRLKISSKGRGKSGGARVITHVHVSLENVYLLTIYDKSEQESISDEELDQMLELLA